MVEFGKRETAAVAALVGVTVVGGSGWWIQHQRQEAAAADLKPTFADGTPAQTAGPDGTAETLPAAGPEESSASPVPEAFSAPSEPSAKPDKIVVFVSGAVKRPGVYTFKPGARLYHAVRAAGGFKPNAQQDALNQAEELRDADQIYIPPKAKAPAAVSVASGAGPVLRGRTETFPEGARRRISLPPPSVTVRPLIIEGTTISTDKAPRPRGRILGKPSVQAATVAVQSGEPAAIAESVSGEAEPPGETTISAEPTASSGRTRSRGSAASSKLKNPGDGLVNINTADLAELQKLPGVGPSTAQKFLEYRTQIGRFASVEQIQDIKGIGPKKYAKLKPFITL